MRILHAIPSLSGGGAERQLGYLATEQARRGHDVAVAFLEEGPAGDAVSLPGVALHRLRAAGNHDPRLFLALVSLIRRLRPQLVHTWILQMDVLAGAAARATRTPWVCREPVSGAIYGGAWKARLRIALARGADAIVSNSRAGEAYWAGLGARGPRFVIRNALPLDAIARAPARAPEALGLAPGRRFVAYVGRLEQEQKNVRHLVEGLCLALAELPVDALVCGDGPERARAERRVRDAGLAGRIRFLGFVPDVWPILKAASAFVSVSYLEGQPNTVMEAMACGCPLVVSDIPMHREFLDETSALWVPPEDPRAIADALRTCLANPEAARARAAEASRRAAAFGVAEMAESYDRVYAGCLERRAA